MDFPDIPIWAAIRRVYALAAFYAVLIVRLSWLPFVALIMLTAAFDIVALAAMPEGGSVDSGWIAIALSFTNEFLVEILIMGFLAIRVFRLLLLEHSDERTVFDGTPLVLLPNYALLHGVVVTGVLAILAAGWVLAQFVGGWLGGWSVLLMLPFALAAMAFYCWMSFVLPAASIPVRYGFAESHFATRGVVPSIVTVTLFAVAPWFLLSVVATQFSGAAHGPAEWTYWAMLPVTAGLHCIRTVFFVIANAVCFEERTGWHPGAEKVEL